MDENKKTCQNCKYFSEHYFIFHDYLRPTGSGHCINTKTHNTKTHRNSSTPACENWQPADNNAEQNERIEKTIRKMAKSLSQILLILKTEK